MRSEKDQYCVIRILINLDLYCVRRSDKYPSDYFAVAIINRLMIFVCRSMWCECSVHIDWYHGNQEIMYFIHRKKLENGSIDVVIPRYLTYNKRYIQRMNEEKPLPLYYLCLSKLLTFYCGCIQTQLSYRKKNKYRYYLSLV